jgi:hypothetical protein
MTDDEGRRHLINVSQRFSWVIYIVLAFSGKIHDVVFQLVPGCFVFEKPLFLSKTVVYYCRDGLKSCDKCPLDKGKRIFFPN